MWIEPERDPASRALVRNDTETQRPLAGRQTAADHFEFLSETSVKVSSLRWIESNPPSPEMAVRIPTFVNETFD